MNIEDIREHCGEKTGTLLTVLCAAAERAADERSELDIQVHATAVDAEGNVIPSSFILFERQVTDHIQWMLKIGFDNAQEWDDAVNYDVPSGYPPLSMPIRGHWIGFDRWPFCASRDTGKRAPQDSPVLRGGRPSSLSVAASDSEVA